MEHAIKNRVRYAVLALFTISLIGAASLYAGAGALIPYIGDAFHLSHRHVGLVATAMLVGMVAMSAMAGMICDRIGDKATLFWSGLVMCAAVLGGAAAHSFSVLLVALFVYGVAVSASIPAGTHAILYFFTREERGVAMGVRQTGVPLGGFFGSILFAAIAGLYGYRAALAACGLLIGILCCASALLYRQPAEIGGDRGVSFRELFKAMLRIAREPRWRLLTAATTLLFIVQTIFIAFLPITLVREAGIAPHIAAAVFACAHLCAVGGRIFWGRLSDRQFRGNRYRPMAITGALSAIGSLIIAATAHMPLAAVLFASLLLGFAGEGFYGLAIMAYAEIGGEEHAGESIGYGLTWVSLGGVFAPIVVGAIAADHGLAMSWLLPAAAGLAAIVPALAAGNLRADVAR